MTRILKSLLPVLAAACLGGCGGGGSDTPATTGSTGTSAGAATTPAPLANVLPVVVDAGPASVADSVNGLFATITVCTPGSTTACQTIDHVQVDTGSVGLRLVAGALNGTAQAQRVTDPATGKVVYACSQFADGYSWGAMAVVDVQIGSRTIRNLSINVIGDSPSGLSPPTDCTQGLSALNGVVDLGANGILGVGPYLQDCGSACAPGSTSLPTGTYYACTATQCALTAVALGQQVANPIAALSADNNGLVVVLPQVPPNGSTQVSGSLYFGINTQADNALGTAQLMTLDGYGDVQTTFGTSVIKQSFIDTGSNGYFFDSTLPLCTTNKDFYCPTSNGVPSTQTEQAQIQGQNTGVTKPVSFTVSHADSVLTASIYADPGLAGPATASGDGYFNHYFDWGLPFFFGRGVYEVFEGSVVGAVLGPAQGF